MNQQRDGWRKEEKTIPRRLKPHSFGAFMAQLKLCPFKTEP
jgi:hypothetical protein